ncbi:MAG: SIMPL domain-containing protein, partial [Luteimonas sp.]
GYLQDSIAKLKASSVPENEIAATSLEIEPRTEYDSEQRKQHFKGIGVTRKLSARFTDQAKLKDFLSKLDTSEEVQVSGVTTELSSEPELRKQLRQKAIKSTREKAEVIAKAYGVHLAGLYSVSDTAPQFEYGITEGDWPTMYQWHHTNEGAGSLDRIEVTGSRISQADIESFQTGYVNFGDKIYAVFLISE